MKNTLARVVAVTSLLVVGLSGCGSDTCTEPCSRIVYDNEYFPLAVGNRWTYEEYHSGWLPLAVSDNGLCESSDTLWTTRFWLSARLITYASWLAMSLGSSVATMGRRNLSSLASANLQATYTDSAR